MTSLLRITWKLAALALLGAVPLGHAQAAQTTVRVSAKVVKPLRLQSRQNLDFGNVLLPITPGTYTISISMTGVLSCGAGLTCTGMNRPATYNIAGSNGQVVRVIAVASDLINAVDGSRLRFTPIAPATITLNNSGSNGQNFNVGGSIAIPSTTTDGTYTGNVEVTVDYQ